MKWEILRDDDSTEFGDIHRYETRLNWEQYARIGKETTLIDMNRFD